jgi:hypothetical protein
MRTPKPKNARVSARGAAVDAVLSSDDLVEQIINKLFLVSVRRPLELALVSRRMRDLVALQTAALELLVPVEAEVGSARLLSALSLRKREGILSDAHSMAVALPILFAARRHAPSRR